MPESITLTHIVLVEFIVALALLAGILLVVLRRERRAHKRLRAEYQRIRSTIKVGSTPLPSTFEGSESEPGAKTDPVALHLYECQQSARKRYHAVTQNRVPKLSAETPFNAKIAALRYIYVSAEMEAYQRGKSGKHSWSLLERKLYDIARWVVERKEASKDKNLRNQVRLLQQRVQALKPFEQETHRLEHKLELAQEKQVQLQAYQEESQSTIDKLRRINYALHVAQNQDPVSSATLRQTLTVGEEAFGDESPEPFGSNERSVRNLDQLSVQYHNLNSELTAGVLDLSRKQEHPGSEQLEQLVQRLERELEKSQAYIETLKQRLVKSAVIPAQVRSGTEAEAAHSQAPFVQTEQAALGKIEETLHIIHSNVADKRAQMGAKPKPEAEFTHKNYTLEELRHLRNNNRQQRSLIVDLEKQLGTLRNSIDTTQDEELREAKILEMLRLEKLVKECEHCISALESEVEFLYTRLREKEEAEQKAQKTTGSDPGALTDELDAVSQKLEDNMLHNRKEAIVKKFALDILHAHGLEDLASALVDAIKSSELIVGFYMQSKLGKADFYRGNQFTDQERRLIKKTTIAAPVAYLNEGIFFASNHMHLLLKEPPEEERELAQTETLLTELLNLCSARIHYLEVSTDMALENRALDEWSNTTREHLMGLEIRYAYQAEDVLRQLQTLREELQQLTGTLDLSASAQAALANAVSECQHRIDQVFGGDESLDQLCTQLLEQLENLPRPSH
ncbi:hypothetical protein [Marinimicrobium sp. ABcell2]|uniref:hypothetical protein n=1 Tax=Marinimicrobium sp. ABcell2 TaxID=3069751 RepID=UPI0027B5B2EF|nr:hypothetical protein [Marinimicrobium sp. ABcell2]MDQ2075604.1 hypothetical protein [Marinimicrobium sp. ABcell2]